MTISNLQKFSCWHCILLCGNSYDTLELGDYGCHDTSICIYAAHCMLYPLCFNGLLIESREENCDSWPANHALEMRENRGIFCDLAIKYFSFFGDT